MKKIISIILLFWLVQATNAQNNQCTSSLKGYVLDEHDHGALEFATIYIIELKTGLVSDSSGYFEFNHLCDGILHIKISHLNCEPITRTVNINGVSSQTFYPEHHAHALKGVDVIGIKKAEQNTQSTESLSAEKLMQSRGQNLGDVLKNISGINTLNTGNSIAKPVMHGMHSNRLLILNNGVRQEGQQWGAEHAPEIDPFIASNITVIKGANSVKYGSDAIAGVILIDTKNLPDTACIGGELHLQGMSNGKAGVASGFLEGKFQKIKNLSWRVQGTLKQSGTVWSPTYILANTALKEQNFSYALAWKSSNKGIDVYYSQFNTDIGILSASHIGNVSDLQTAFTASVPLVTGKFTYQIERPYQHIEHELFKTKAYIGNGTLGKLNMVYARQFNRRYEYDKYRPLNSTLAALNKPELAFDITSHSMDLVWEHNRIKKLNGAIGISGITQANTYEGRFLIPNFTNNAFGIFWTERIKIKTVELEAGCRYDNKQLQIFKYADDNNPSLGIIKPLHVFKNVSANLGAIFAKDSSLNISCNAGTAWRAPSVNELYANGLHQGAATLEYGNATLKLEKAYTLVSQIKYRGKNWQLDVSPYYNYIQNFIYRQAAPAPVMTIRGAFPAFYYQQCNAVLKGLDAMIIYHLWPGIDLTQKASILRATNIDKQQWLIMMPADRYDTEITKKFVKKTKGSIAAAFVYVNKQWRVPANSDFVVPPPQYFLINLQSELTLNCRHQRIILGFGIQNLLNKSYRDYLDRFRYYADAMGRNYTCRVTIPFNQSFHKKQNKSL